MFDALTEPEPTGDEADRRLREIEQEGAAVAAAISRLQARQVELAAEVRRLEGRLVGMTAQTWVTWRFGLTPAEGGRVMALADRLRELPKLADAFATGRLSEGVTNLLSRVATPATEDALLGLSEVATGAQLQVMVRDHRRARVGQPATGSRDASDAYFRSTAGDDGWWDVRGRLSPRDGAVVDAAVRAAVDAEHMPDAPRASSADGLTRLADHYLDGLAPAGGVVPERFETIIVLDADGAVLQGSGPIDDRLLSELLCESVLSAVVRDRGVPVTATAPSRYATPPMLRALWVRDRCCRFPACGRTHGLIAHHIKPFAVGGPTRLDNLILLCRAHHRVIHRPGWRITLADDGTTRFTGPDDTIVAPAHRRPSEGDGAPTAHDPDGRSAGPRHRGSYDPLTDFGRDVILHNWLELEDEAELSRVDQRPAGRPPGGRPPDGEHPPPAGHAPDG